MKTSIMHLGDCINSFIKLCSVFGLTPFSRVPGTSKWTKNRLNGIITVSYLIMVIVIFLLCLIFNGTIIDHTDSGIIVAIVVYTIVIICLHSFLTLCETFSKRDRHIKLLNLFAKLESLSTHYQGVQLDYIGIKRTIHRVVLFWTLETFGLLILNVLILFKTRDQNDLCFVLTYTLPHLISKLSYIYWIVLVTILHENVRALMTYSRSLCGSKENMRPDIPPFEVFSWTYRKSRSGKFSAATFELFTRCYCTIWESSVLINDVVFWSFPIGFLNEFSVLVFNCFFLIKMIQSLPNVELMPFIHTILWATSNLVNVILLTSTCERAAEAVIYTIYSVCIYSLLLK